MPNGYVSQIQINGGDVQNIGSCAYAVCDTAEDVSVKVVTLPGFVLKDGATIHIKFTYRNIAFNPKLNVNGTGDKTILLNTNSGFDSSLNLSSQYNVDQLWMAGAVVTLTYDGTYWVVNNPSRITSPYTYNLSAGNTIESGSYMILADIEWELCNGASSATARVFPFKVCMSTMVDGLYRDRSAIMEVFVGGSYNKKDYVDIMIHDESEYHVNNDYVFDSLVDSIFIYFEYEVSSGNVISKRTGHLLGKVPSRWSSFQLVPLTNGSVSSANPDEDHHFLKLDIAHSASSFVPSETSQTSIPSGNVLPTTVGVHRYLIKARLKPFEIGQLSGNGSTAGQYLKSNGSTSAPSWETMDTTPTASSAKAVTSGGVKTSLDAKQNTISITTNTSTPADNDTVIMQASGMTNTTSFLRRTMSKIWDYIKSKADSVYVPFGWVAMNELYGMEPRLWNVKIDDAFWAFDKRYNVTWKVYDSTTDEEILDKATDVHRLFSLNSNISQNHPRANEYEVVTIQPNNNTGSNTMMLSNYSGKLLMYFYYIGTPADVPSVRFYKTDGTWVVCSVSKLRNNAYVAVFPKTGDALVNKIEIRIEGRDVGTSGGTSLTSLTYLYDRSNPNITSVVTKHENEQLFFGNITAPSFIKRDGTSQQVLLANGTTINMPSTTGTNKDTLLRNLVSGLSVPNTDVTDTMEIITSSSGSNGFNTTNYVNIPYKRPMTKVWDYIKGKADTVYSTIADLANYYTKSEVDTALNAKQDTLTAGTGLSKSGNTINHSNSVTANTSGLGSSVRIPAIEYDAQGHITYGTYYSVFSHEQYSAVKCGYVSNGTNGAGWYKIADITYWDATYTRYDVIISVVGTGANAHDVGLLRIRGINAATAGVITGVNMGWIYKTPGTSEGFATNCIRATKTETNSSSGATLSLFIYIPTNNVSYNFLVLNEGLGGASIRGYKLVFANSTTKQTTEPAPTYVTNFLPLEIGNQSNCLEITDSNWQSYLTASNAGGAVPSNIANGDILTIPEGVSQVFFNTTNEASIALVRGASTLNRFPRNGVRITIAGNWKPQENGGYLGGNAVGRFSAYLYVYRGGVASSSANYRMTHAFEDFMYFNGVWYSKGY